MRETAPRAAFRSPAALLPLAMSLAALGLLAVHVMSRGPGVVAPTGDEGTPARLFQLLLLAQLPIVGWFALTWVPRAPRQALLVLVLQVAAALTAIGAVLYLEGR